jgi:hypothetical protein
MFRQLARPLQVGAPASVAPRVNSSSDFAVSNVRDFSSVGGAFLSNARGLPIVTRADDVDIPAAARHGRLRGLRSGAL